uniref:SCP domain-containing protein n=1 Tax=Parastrongyloides trichosuri TaxID=131310 RepID=A0A0N4ZM51_PARTI
MTLFHLSAVILILYMRHYFMAMVRKNKYFDDNALEHYAQQRAVNIAQSYRGPVHIKRSGYEEGVASITNCLVQRGVKLWCNGKYKYDFVKNKSKNDMIIKTFPQIVWQETNKIEYGITSERNELIIFSRLYKGQRNVLNKMIENVRELRDKCCGIL